MGQLPWEGQGFGHGMCPGVLSFCLHKHFLSCPAIVEQNGFLDMDWQGLQPVNKHLGRSVDSFWLLYSVWAYFNKV